VVALSIDNEDKLEYLYNKLYNYGAHVARFTEPDIGDQLTSICYYGTPVLQRLTNKLDLAFKN